MAERQALRYQVLDSSGVPIAGASIQVAQLGTTTNITQTMYAGLSGATTIANPLISDASGWVQAYFDGTDAVALKRVTVIPTLTGFTFTTRNVQLGSDYGVLDDGVAPIKATSVEATDRFNMARGSAGDPTSLQVGDMWYNTTTNALQWEDNTGTQTVSSTTGDITGVEAGDGLTGGGVSGDVTLNVGAGNAINVDADDVDVSVNNAATAAAALAGDDKILISDTDDSNITKSATISQINPTMLDGGNNVVYYTDSSGNVSELPLGSASEVLTSSGATSPPTFSAIPTSPTVGANKTMYTNNSDVETGLAFGAAGTVLTSGGPDATATPPTWESAASGGVYTATTSAAITNGHAAVLDAAGTVSPVSNVQAAGPPSTATIYAGTSTVEPMAQGSTVYDEDTNTLFVVAVSSNSIELIPCTVDWTSTSPTITPGTAITSGLTSYFYNGGMAMYDKLNDKIVVAGRSYSTSVVEMQSGTVSGSGSTATISWDTVTSVTGYAPSYIFLEYMRAGPAFVAGGTVALVCANNASGYREALWFDVSGSTPSASGPVMDNGTGRGTITGQIVCDGSGTLKSPYIDTGGNAGWDTFVYGTGAMGGTGTPGPAAWGNWIDMCWDTTNNRGLIAIATSSSLWGNTYVYEITDGAAGVVTGTDINWANTATNYMNVYRTGSCFFDVLSGTVMVYWANSGDYHMWTPVTLTGSGPTAGTQSPTNNTQWTQSSQPYGMQLFHAYASGTNLNFAAGIFSGSSAIGSKNHYGVSNAYLATNEEMWLGVAKNTTTGAGQSQEMYIRGGIATEGLSGLTIGSNYYWQTNGQVGTTNTGGDRFVGRAIAADKILVENTGTGAA